MYATYGPRCEPCKERTGPVYWLHAVLLRLTSCLVGALPLLTDIGIAVRLPLKLEIVSLQSTRTHCSSRRDIAHTDSRAWSSIQGALYTYSRARGAHTNVGFRSKSGWYQRRRGTARCVRRRCIIGRRRRRSECLVFELAGVGLGVM